MVQIQFLDKNVVGALVPAFSMKPDRVVFLYDPKEVGKNQRKEVEEAIRVRLPKTAVQYVQSDMHQMSVIKGHLNQVADIYKDQEIQIDITGGAEIMTACGLMFAMERSFVVTYANFHEDVMMKVQTGEKIAPIEQVTMKDYLTAIGGKCLKASVDVPKEGDEGRILKMIQIIFANERKWDKFVDYLFRNGFSAHGVQEFSLGRKKEDQDIQFILRKFLELGFAKKVGNDRYRYASSKDKTYMTVSGIWLELYIYLKAKEYFEDVYLGVDIDWNKDDICTGRDNEIDVVAMHHSQPIFISCKMRTVTKEYVYEVYSMAKRLGGSYGKSIIATTVDVRNTGDARTGISMRLKKMKMGLIQTEEFSYKSTKEIFDELLATIA